MNMFDLTGRRALVTGGTQGIGRAIVELFEEAGARLIVASKDRPACGPAQAEVRTFADKADFIICDLTQDPELEALAAHAISQKVDILVCNAGISGPAGPLHELGPSDYHHLFSLNLHSVVKLTSRVVPAIAANGGGSVILMSSIAGLRGNKSIGAYGIAKAGIAQLARNLAVEWGPQNVRVNSISPGLIRTPFAAPILTDERYLERRLQLTPLRRVGDPSEVAAAALFLASRGGAFVTGHNLVVDGGTTITDGN